jgi:hypothetical protein
MAWRAAKSLLKLRDQINRQYPRRKKHSDGMIGDAAHASRKSDHNPWIKDGGVGVVSAFDITHDPPNGCHTWNLAEHLRTKRDPRIKYVISNGRIFSSPSWTWRRYTGSNPHSSHMHVSVHSTKNHYDSEREWDLGQKMPPGPPVTGPDPDLPVNRPTLRRGSKGPLVLEVQTLLQAATLDGDYGPITEAAVRAFQSSPDNDLKVDGIVGPNTWRELDKIEQKNDGESEKDQFEGDASP